LTIEAYDTINRAELVEIMKEFGIPMKLVRLVKMTLANTNSKVKTQGKLSPSFETAIGLREGDSLSTLLFNLCRKKIIRNIRINPGGKMFNRTRQCLAYVVGVVILGRSEGYIRKTLEAITHQIGLKMNDTKTIIHDKQKKKK
jgi:hypothetical protein